MVGFFAPEAGRSYMTDHGKYQQDLLYIYMHGGIQLCGKLRDQQKIHIHFSRAALVSTAANTRGIISDVSIDDRGDYRKRIASDKRRNIIAEKIAHHLRTAPGSSHAPHLCHCTPNRDYAEEDLDRFFPTWSSLQEMYLRKGFRKMVTSKFLPRKQS